MTTLTIRMLALASLLNLAACGKKEEPASFPRFEDPKTTPGALVPNQPRNLEQKVVVQMGDGSTIEATKVEMPSPNEWYENKRRSAESGDAESLLDLGRVHRTGGCCFEKNMSKAIQYFVRASERGSAYASIDLAEIYEEGKDVPVDLGRSKHFFSLALEQDGTNDFVRRLAESGLARIASGR